MSKFSFKFASMGFVFVVCLVNRLFGVPPKGSKSAGPSSSSGRKNLVVITDMEPDDRIALEMIHSQLAERILAIGTTVLNAERKAALVRNALEGTQLEGVKVFVGSGGGENEYPLIRSTKAALTYGDKEGKGILDEATLNGLKNSQPQKDGNEFQKYLIKLLEKESGIDFLVLAPPTDLTAVLTKKGKLEKAIGKIHLMGGWNTPKEGSNVCRSSYNVNMDAKATAQLLEMANEERVAVVLYSSHVLARDLGLSINGNNFPNLIKKITESKAPGIEKFRKAGESWDTHLVQCYEKLKDVVGPHKGKQFTPADPMTVMGYLWETKPKDNAGDKKLIRKYEKVIIPSIGNLSDEGYEVKMDKSGKGITLASEIDREIFESEMERILGEINDEFKAKGKSERKRHKGN